MPIPLSPQIEPALRLFSHGGSAVHVLTGVPKLSLSSLPLEPHARVTRSLRNALNSKNEISWDKLKELLRLVGSLHGVSEDQASADIGRLEMLPEPNGAFRLSWNEIIYGLEQTSTPLAPLSRLIRHEHKLSLEAASAEQRQDQIGALRRSDTARTRSGQAVLNILVETNDQDTAEQSMQRLTLLTHFQLMASGLLIARLGDIRHEDFAYLLPGTTGAGPVRLWYEELKRFSGAPNWAALYLRCHGKREDNSLSEADRKKFDRHRNGIRKYSVQEIVCHLGNIARHPFPHRPAINELRLLTLQTGYQLALALENLQSAWDRCGSSSPLDQCSLELDDTWTVLLQEARIRMGQPTPTTGGAS